MRVLAASYSLVEQSVFVVGVGKVHVFEDFELVGHDVATQAELVGGPRCLVALRVGHHLLIVVEVCVFGEEGRVVDLDSSDPIERIGELVPLVVLEEHLGLLGSALANVAVAALTQVGSHVRAFWVILRIHHAVHIGGTNHKLPRLALNHQRFCGNLRLLSAHLTENLKDIVKTNSPMMQVKLQEYLVFCRKCQVVRLGK